MRVLVVVASKHQGTAEIGDAVVEELRAAGHEARRMAPAAVRNLDGVDAVILGSAVYMTQWMEPARAFVQHWSGQLRHLPVWAFSSGLAGLPGHAVADPERVRPFLRDVDPLDHVTFRGRLDPTLLGLRERSVARTSSAPEGDFREWTRIRAWARAIAAELTEHLAVRSVAG